MNTGALISTGLAVAAVVGLGVVFVNNASPYVTIDKLATQGQGVHVVGQIVPKTLQQDTMAGKVNFKLSDPTGELKVAYSGPPLSDLSRATQVVVIGSMVDDTFQAKQMLVKCPSKYESEKGAKGAQTL
jgi:cytochrome c-type biogenesis protein CcmE